MERIEGKWRRGEDECTEVGEHERRFHGLSASVRTTVPLRRTKMGDNDEGSESGFASDGLATTKRIKQGKWSKRVDSG